MHEDLIEHSCFKLLDECIKFYDRLSYSTFRFITGGFSIGTGMLFNLDSDIFLSISGSMKSIKRNLYNGQINDAYTLIRKYYDVITINIYEIVLLKKSSALKTILLKKLTIG